MTNQIFLTTYNRDFPFLRAALLSLRKFSKNFLPPCVCVSQEDLKGVTEIVDWMYPGAGICIKPVRVPQGFMSAQISMLRSDEYCRSADNIYFLGSDCLITDTFDSNQYLHDGKPVVLYRPYAKLDPLIWQKGTSRVLGFPVENEYMGRLPSVYPRQIFGALRDHVERTHGKAFDDYIYEADAANHDTSEANILGAFAHKFYPESCHWIDATVTPAPEKVGWAYPVGQFWSHGGLNRPMECCAILPDGTCTAGRTPRSVIDQVLFGIT